MMGINLSIAMSDVVIDATITIFAGNDEQIITNLHTFSSSCVTVCSIIGYLTSGIVIEMVGVLNLFFVSSIISFIVLISTLVGFLNEYPHNCKDKIFSFRSELYDRNPSLFFNALFVCCVALVLTILMVIYQSNLFNQIVILTLLSILLIFIPYFTLKSTSINAAKLSIILFTSDALTPNLETTMFYWYTNSINGPQFSSTYIGFINTFGYFVTFLGVIIFSKFFRDYSYNNLMIGAQVFINEIFFHNFIDISMLWRSS